ncbi:hypothetical protein WDU94_009354 [Cyamophila willieti]
MADNEQKAIHLLAEAEKKLAPSKGFFGQLFGGGSKVDEAIDCYTRAGNLFKMAKKWSSAGQAFVEAANLHLKSGTKHEAASNLLDAANCFKKTDNIEAIECYSKAIVIYTDMGRFTMAAKHHQNIAEIYETDCVDQEKAVEHYEQAATYFKGEESNSSANKCLLKVAHHAALLQNHDKAIEIYEQVGASSLESSLLKYSAKEYFFRAALCHLCIDVINAHNAIDRYKNIYPAFQDAREFKLLRTLIEHIEEQNVDGFTEAVKDYDSISRLDQWYTTILLRIKKQVNDNPDLK